MRRFGLVFLLLAACSSESDERSLPYGEAERARGLGFLRKPAVVTRTRASYAEEVAREVSDEEVTRYHTVLGRLGFVPTDFDPRAAAQKSATRVGAYYEPTDGGRITLFEEEEHPAIMVHELVHALQDQHFGLTALDESAKSTDELLALRALAEGDARVAETRFVIEQGGRDPLVFAPIELSRTEAKRDAEEILSFPGAPAFLSAYASFCYTFGAVLVAQAVGVYETPPRWSTAGADALYRGGTPRSTEGVLRTVQGWEIDPIVEVGLTVLPEPLRDKYEIRDEDRLGAWFSWILLREAGEQDVDVTLDWDGDQLLVLGAKGGAEPPSAIVWTSAWENSLAAERVVRDLRRLHAASAESLVIERRDEQVVLAKGTLPQDEVQMLANAALYDRTFGPRPAERRKTINLERFFFDGHSTQATKSSTSMRHGTFRPPSR